MEEILKRIEENIKLIKDNQVELSDIEEKNDNVKSELEKLKAERAAISDTESGFYKDLSDKISDKDSEFREINAKRMQKDNEIKEMISKKKEEIINKLESKKKYIDDNRNVDLKGIKEEKEKIERELKLNDTTKEEFEKMSDSEKREVRKAKENYLNNKRRLNDMAPQIELMKILDGKEPKDRFIEIDNWKKNIEKDFNKDNMDKVLSNIKQQQYEQRKKEIKEAKENWYDSKGFEEALEEAQKKKEERENKISDLKKEYPKTKTYENYRKNIESPQNNDSITTRNVDPSKNGNNITTKTTEPLEDNTIIEKENIHKIKSIFVSEKEGYIYCEDSSGKREPIKIEDALKAKKENFKNLNIYNRCKNVANNWVEARILKRKINPEIVAVLKDDKEALKGYIESIYKGKQYPFYLTHDLRNSKRKILHKMKMNFYAKYEKQSGAKILGAFWDKNNALESGNVLKQHDTNVKDMKQEEELLEQTTNSKDYTIPNYNRAINVSEVKIPKEGIKKQYKVNNSNNIIEKKAVATINLEKFEMENEKIRTEVVKNDNDSNNRIVHITDKDGNVVGEGKRLWSINDGESKEQRTDDGR